MENEIISFIRQKDYDFIKNIGRGGLGKTILIRDNEINEIFVCKKYEPLEGMEYPQFCRHFIIN